MRRAVLVLIVLLLGIRWPAGAAVAQDAGLLNVDQYVLDNGLEVILVEDHSAPTVAVDVWYRVGGADDPPGRSGFAHLFEHMMFQGSANVPRGAHNDLVSAAGGSANATTGIDRTNYFQTLPANQLPLGLWLEADRMRSLVVDDASFAREREVVKEEYRLRIQNQPYGEAVLRLQTAPYDYEPYRRPVIGSIEDLDAATADEARAFHAAYYKPDNAVLVVAGDIDPDEARELVRRYFADIPRRDPPPSLPPYQPSGQRLGGETTLQDPLARVPATFIGYGLPPRDDPDFYAADVLATILGGGGSSRLARALVDTGLAASATAYVIGNVGPSAFGVSLVPNADVEPARLEQTYADELARIQATGVDLDELTKAVSRVRTGRIRGLQSALGLAESVQAANFYLGGPRALLADLERYRAITSDDVRRVGGQYLASQAGHVIRVVPAEGGASPSPSPATAPTIAPTTDPVAPTSTPSGVATPPPPLPVGELSLPQIVESRLSNGLLLIVVSRTDLPLLSLQLVLPGGQAVEPADRAGLAQAVAGLLTRGTASRSAGEIAAAIEGIGGSLGAAATIDDLSVTASVLVEHADLAFELLGDVVLNPSFPQDELDGYRRRALVGLRSALANPGQVASRAFDAIVYGPHPYGRLATEPSLQALTREAVIDYYRAQATPTDAFLVVIGDMAPEEAARRAEATFGGWSASGRAADAAFPPAPLRSDRAVYLVDRPGSSQAEVLVGHLGIRGNSPERFPLVVANQVLGGGASSRLFRNLREEKGYTYGVYSGFSFPRDVGDFVVGAAVRGDVVEPTVREVLAELERLRAEPTPAAELAVAKSYLVGSFALRFETDQALAGQIVSLKLRGLPIDTLRAYIPSIEQVDTAATREAALRQIRPDEVAIVVVGDAATIRDGLARIAPVISIDADGRPRP